MRVAFNTFPDSLVSQLRGLNAQQARLQNQAATGRRITNLEDDPAAMRRVLQAQAQGSQYAQHRQNITSLQQRATSVYSSVDGLRRNSTRARDIATLADGTKSQKELSTYASEINQLLEQSLQTANAKGQGSYLFGGTASGQAPFVATRDPNGRISSISYQGNESAAAVEIGPGVTVSVDMPGGNSGAGSLPGLISDAANGADFFNHLISLRDHLLSGDVSAIAGTDRAALAKDEDNLILHAGTNALLQKQLEDADSIASAQTASLQQAVSQDADADLATTLSRLSATQTAYQAALQSGASLLNRGQSLLDYLR